MSEDKKRPIERTFQVCLLVLGISIVLNLAISYLRADLPWIAGAAAVALTAWVVVAVIRWRRSKW
jgi:hypothetical protein